MTMETRERHGPYASSWLKEGFYLTRLLLTFSILNFLWMPSQKLLKHIES